MKKNDYMMIIAKSPRLVVWNPEGRMNGSLESSTGSLESRRKDEW